MEAKYIRITTRIYYITISIGYMEYNYKAFSTALVSTLLIDTKGEHDLRDRFLVYPYLYVYCLLYGIFYIMRCYFCLYTAQVFSYLNQIYS